MTLLESAVPGQALVLCAGERDSVDVVANSTERELFDTHPAQEAERNRHRRRCLLISADQKPVPAADPTPVAPHASADSSSSERSWHLFDDLEPDDSSPIPLPTWRRRP